MVSHVHASEAVLGCGEGCGGCENASAKPPVLSRLDGTGLSGPSSLIPRPSSGLEAPSRLPSQKRRTSGSSLEPWRPTIALSGEPVGKRQRRATTPLRSHASRVFPKNRCPYPQSPAGRTAAPGRLGDASDRRLLQRRTVSRTRSDAVTYRCRLSFPEDRCALFGLMLGRTIRGIRAGAGACRRAAWQESTRGLRRRGLRPCDMFHQPRGGLGF